MPFSFDNETTDEELHIMDDWFEYAIQHDEQKLDELQVKLTSLYQVISKTCLSLDFLKIRRGIIKREIQRRSKKPKR